jgi:outer membrane protein OmpA-like peptidoglycan-associated protein
MLTLFPLIGLAFATHVTTYDTNVKWTKPPFSGLESLSVDPAVVVSQIKPIRPPLPADIEVVPNLATRGEEALVFTNPMSQWSELTLNGLQIGIIGPYATMRLEGLKSGLYEISLEPPTHRVRNFSVRILPPVHTAPPISVIVGQDRIDLSDKIYFDFDSAKILEESFGLLDALAKAITEHPEVLLVRIEGHTDSQGDDAYNMKLSQERAASVRDYLVKAGVAADRLNPVGFGESRPVDSAETDEAFEKNRRVELIVEKRVEAPAPAPVAPVKPKGKKKTP